jgi:hypothetical protein
MRDQIVVVLLVVALIAGAGIAYYRTPITPPETTTQTYTVTTALNQGSNLVKCVIVYYEVDAAEFLRSNSTSYGSTTRSYQVSNYTTTTSVEQAVGYATSTRVALYESGTSTHTGPALASWDEAECIWIP